MFARLLFFVRNSCLILKSRCIFWAFIFKPYVYRECKFFSPHSQDYHACRYLTLTTQRKNLVIVFCFTLLFSCLQKLNLYSSVAFASEYLCHYSVRGISLSPFFSVCSFMKFPIFITQNLPIPMPIPMPTPMPHLHKQLSSYYKIFEISSKGERYRSVIKRDIGDLVLTLNKLLFLNIMHCILISL